MKKIPVTSCADCEIKKRIEYELGSGERIIRCYNIATNEIITTEPVEITDHVKNKTFHPDCKLEDDNEWQEMDVLPPLKKGDTETTNTVLIKHDWRDGNEQPDYYTGCYWYKNIDSSKNVKFNKAWRVYGDENDYHRKRIKLHPKEYQWKTI